MNRKENNLYGSKMRTLDYSAIKATYQADCDSSNGYITFYHVFAGIDVAYTSIKASFCTMRNERFPHVIEIAYCYTGRFECKYKHDNFIYLGEGDFAVSILSPEQEPASFPVGSYEGFAIIIDIEKTGRYFNNVIEGITIDLGELIEKFCSKNCCVVFRADSKLLNVFNEIYKFQEYNNIGYLRLKILEALYLLSKLSLQEDNETYSHYSAKQLKKIQVIKKKLVEDLDNRKSLKQIATENDISITFLKTCFKDVYGKSIYAFQKEYKMHKATKLLTDTNLKIVEIAGKLGYENPNKFSTAFKKIIGMSPREYRKLKK